MTDHKYKNGQYDGDYAFDYFAGLMIAKFNKLPPHYHSDVVGYGIIEGPHHICDEFINSWFLNCVPHTDQTKLLEIENARQSFYEYHMAVSDGMK